MIDTDTLRALPILNWKSGTSARSFARVAAPDQAGPDTLVFVSTPAQLEQALHRQAGGLIILEKLAVPTNLKDALLFTTAHIGLAMAAVLPAFDRKNERFGARGTIHPKAAIDPTAQIGRDVTIDAGAVIGAGARLGDGAIIGATTVVEPRAVIGARTRLHPCVFVGADCEIGEDSEIHPHTTIGSDGFGFAQDAKFKHHKLPQLGRVIIGDRVEIGANCAIDRAAFDVTSIGSGTKLDNLCHVGHNVRIGEDCVIAGGFFVAGSSTIGNRFMVGGGAVVSDHVLITDGVVLAGRSTVTNDIDKAGAYGGYPLQPLRDSLKTIANLAQLTPIRKQVARISKHLGLSEEE